MIDTFKIATAALLFSSLAHALDAAPGQVQLNGLLGNKAALLVLDGEPRTVQVGSAINGVKLIGIEEQRAVVEYGGRRYTLSMGSSPGRIGQPSAPVSKQIVLPAGPGGHFTATGSINGQTTQFLVDTGATSVAISQIEADRLGLKYLYGRRIVTQTANGLVPAHMFQLATVRIGDVEIRNVDAIVIPGQMSHVLLGNSFLTRFQMRRENDVMTLEQRY